MKKYIVIIACLIGMFFTSQSQAILIGTDLYAEGDHLLTIDSDTNLQWLDLPVTENLSYDTVSALMAGPDLVGFRYATMDEVIELAEHAGSPETLQQLLGKTPESQNVEYQTRSHGLEGVFAKWENNIIGWYLVRYDVENNIGGCLVRCIGGSYLVRCEVTPPPSAPVPEPATILLLGAGLVGLAGFSRTKMFKK